MKKLIYGLIILLAIAHQDFWFWDNSETLVFSFIPIGLAYHAAVSIAASILWLLAVRYCWPSDADLVQEDRSTGENAPATEGRS